MLRKNGLSSFINDICSTMGAVQIIIKPTRETESSASQTTILVTIKDECIRENRVINTSIIDHYMVYGIRKGRKMRLPPKIIE